MGQDDLGFWRNYRDEAFVTILSLLVLAIYLQTARFEFINLDDNLYVYANDAVRSGLNWNSIKWAFTTMHAANWHPLTWLSLMIDVQLFGGGPGAIHAMNSVYHLVNTVLAFLVFKALTQDSVKSAIIAALFAVHPMHVESVAWISERKDLLCMMFSLLTVFSYLRFSSTPAGKRARTFLLTIVLFALALMSKPMAVSLPFVLLLIDYWPLDRLRSRADLKQLVIEKIPFFALAAASSVITVMAQRSAGALETLDVVPMSTRFANALLSYLHYVISAVCPVNLAPSYPYDPSISVFELGVAVLFISGVTMISLRIRKTRPWFFTGWFWFIGTLVPVIGIVQVGSQPMADRYTYFPYFGLFVIAVYGSGELIARFKIDKRIVAAVAMIVIAVLSFLAFRQTSFWRNTESLYTRTLSLYKDNAIISHNYCYALMTADRLEEAEPHCRDSARVKPSYWEPHNTLGIISLKRKMYADAEANFQRAIELGPSTHLIYSNLALSQTLQNRPDEGEQNLKKAVELGGNVSPVIFAGALVALVEAYLAQNNHEKAVENLRRLIYIHPGDVQLRKRLAESLIELKRYSEARAVADAMLAANAEDEAAKTIIDRLPK